MAETSSDSSGAVGAKRLAIILPGMGGTEEKWRGLLDRLKDDADLEGIQWQFVDLRLSVTTRKRAADISTRVLAELRERWTNAGEPEEVWLIGSSIGALLARRAYLDALSDPKLAPLAAAVRRIILFAGINRGINVVDPKGSGWLLLRFTGWLYRVFPLMRRFLVSDILKGSAFITNLRIEWIRQFAKPDFRQPAVVQFLPGNDWLVKREDSRDVEQFRDAEQVDVAGAKHKDVFRPEAARDPDARYEYLKRYIVTGGSGSVATPHSVRPETFIFLVHGIRANNREWAKGASNAIMRLLPDAVTVPVTYGFFSAAQFAIPATRRKHVRKIMDEYTERLADNPTAEFRFLGHSNGTYLLGESLRDVPGMRFSKVVLVGSVLPREYDWRSIFDRGQVTVVANHRSNQDWPVAHLCSALRGLGMRDIGTAGYEGFDYQDTRLTEHFYHDGDHSAPLTEPTLPRVAASVCDSGTDKGEHFSTTRVELPFYKRAPVYMPRLAQLGIVTLIAAVAWYAPSSQNPEQIVLGVIGGLLAVLFVLDII